MVKWNVRYLCFLYSAYILCQQISITDIGQLLICPWHILEQCCKAVVIKHLHISGHHEWEMYQTGVVYLHFAVGFTETHFNKMFVRK
jgi:hypothetical protein